MDTVTSALAYCATVITTTVKRFTIQAKTFFKKINKNMFCYKMAGATL